MGMILRIASSRIVGQGDIVGRSGYFSLNLSANSVMRGRLDARRTLKSLVADLRFIFRKTLVAKIRIIFSDQAHSSLKKRGFAKIQNNDEPSTPTGVELQVTAHDTMCGSKCLPNPRPQRRSNLSTDYMVRPRWGRMYRSHLAIRKSLTLRLTGVRPFSGSVCLHTFILHKRLNSNIKSVYILQRIYLLCSY